MNFKSSFVVGDLSPQWLKPLLQTTNPFVVGDLSPQWLKPLLQTV